LLDDIVISCGFKNRIHQTKGGGDLAITSYHCSNNASYYYFH